MATIDESGLAGKTRDRPIGERLRLVLLAAADDAKVDTVFIASGGQPGSGGKRTGSHRHDDGNAADLDLIQNGKTLRFTDLRELETFKRFVTAAAARGAIGIGAAEGYMGASRIHVGFGNGPQDRTKVVWGAGGTSANAPAWLREAAQRGWAQPVDTDISEEFEAASLSEGEDMADDPQVERFRPLLDFIALKEGTANQPGDGYNTSLGYGRYLPGKREMDLTSKSLDEIYQIGLQMRRHPANPNSSALGRYQITGQTLRDFQARRRLPGTTRFSSQIQDLFATDIIVSTGRNARTLAGRWASLKSVSESDIFAAYDKEGAPMSKPTPLALDNFPPDIRAALERLLQRPAADGDWPVLQQGGNNEGAVKRLQTMLDDLRYYTGGADGKFGPNTRSAVALFQLDNGLPVTGAADAATWAALTNGSARPLGDQRPGLTADDVRKQGSQTIRNADFTRYAGWLASALGLGGLGKSGACAMDTASTLCTLGNSTPTTPSSTSSTISATIENAESLKTSLSGVASDPGVAQLLQGLDLALQSLKKVAVPAVQQAASSDLTSVLTSSLAGLLPGGLPGSLLALGLGFAVNRFGNKIIDRRVSDQRTGKHIGDKTA